MVEERMRLKEMVNIKALFASLIIHTFQFIFFSRNSVFLSQQISRNSVSAYFFSEANGAKVFFLISEVVLVVPTQLSLIILPLG